MSSPPLMHDREYFTDIYAGEPDPWHFDTSWYERRKFALTVASLPNETYRRAFEPGCANGADTRTGSIELDHQPVSATLGGPGWYLTRPGFWHGACGPAACWVGAAIGIADVAEELIPPERRASGDDDPHRRAHLGALRALTRELRAVLAEAGRQIDLAPDDVDRAERRARSVRHLVERACTEILDRFGSAFGPRPLVTDAAVAQRAADLQLYLRQDHAERDLAQLGRAGLDGSS